MWRRREDFSRVAEFEVRVLAEFGEEGEEDVESFSIRAFVEGNVKEREDGGEVVFEGHIHLVEGWDRRLRRREREEKGGEKREEIIEINK